MSQSRLFRLIAAGAMVAALSACASRAPVDAGGGPVGPTTPANPAYPTNPTGPVSGGSTAPLAGSAQDFSINVGDRVYFDLDSYAVRPDAYARLDAQADWLRRYPSVTVRIEGNADERGTREYNLALGARRAESIRNYLIDRGVAAHRIDTISFGKERPIAEGSSEASWARNRNGHTAIVSGAR